MCGMLGRSVCIVGVVGRELLGAPRTAKVRSFMKTFITVLVGGASAAL
eukprot:COSAG02_NODE_10640_length_1893_cov_1.705128_1_plen_48_part_00